jgi:hypothetical protein
VGFSIGDYVLDFWCHPETAERQGEHTMVRKVIGASSALILLAVTVAVLPQRGKADDVDKVLVVNGPKKPVPVTGNVGVSGTANVNVTNQPTVSLAPGTGVGVSGTVNANVTNTPNVNVTGLPAVQLAPGTNVGINGTPGVNVLNQPMVGLAPGSILAATNADALQPVELDVAFSIPDNSDLGSANLFTVPAGKRFVLEDFSGEALIAPGDSLLSAEIGVGSPSVPVQVRAVPSLTGNFPQLMLDAFFFGRIARGYAEPGATVTATVLRDGTLGKGGVDVAISGYLVDMR